MAIKKGCYLVNTDLFNKRAHSIQILKTVEAINLDPNIELSIIAPKYSKKNVDELFRYYGIKKKFPIIFVQNFFFKKGGRLPFFFFLIPSFFRLLKLKNKITFLYFRSEYFYLLIKCPPFKKINFFYEVHRKGLNRKQNLIKKKIIKSAHGVVCITKGLKKYYSEFNKNIVVAHDAVDLKRFDIKITRRDARKKLGIDLSKKIAVYVGTISQEKGIDILLQTANQLSFVDFYLLGRGGGDIWEKLKNYKNVKLIGHIDNNLVPLYLKMADFLLMPHHPSTKFQSPMKLFEYLASQRFIISSDLENIREVLNDTNALFYKHDNPQDFVKKINLFLANQKSYENKLKIMKNKIKSFTWRKRGKIISNLIRNSLN